MSIAVEISITTTPEWEVHNIQKCLAAGYEKIVVCSNRESKLVAIQEVVQKALRIEEIEKVRFITPDKFQSLFVPQTSKETTTVIKGYRVKVNYEQDGVNQQNLLKSIINTSQKR